MMTQKQIKNIIYSVVQDSPIPGIITGGVYIVMRPTDSIVEDCVISLISGITGKFLQDGAAQIKIIFNDLKNGNHYMEDTSRGEVFDILLFDLSTTLLKNDLGVSFDITSREIYVSRIASEQSLDVYQHYVILKMNFKIN